MLKTLPNIRVLETPPVTGSTVEQLIGDTPLLQLHSIWADLPDGVQLFAKAEWFNPGGSIKDRPALNIIRTAIATGQLTPGKTLIDATSGNTGIGYAMIGASLGYSVRLVLPANVSPERLAILRAYGADLVLTEPELGADGAIQRVRQMVAAEPELYFYADQYGNTANWEAHYFATGPEIWQQTGGSVTHFVAGIGTSGTMMGVGRFLRAMNPGIKLITLQPTRPESGLEGLKHMPTAIVPAIYDDGLADENRFVDVRDAEAMARRLARREGLFVGISAGAAVYGALSVARELQAGVVVTVLPDAGYKYVSKEFWTV
jgi:cysteine synthase B